MTTRWAARDMTAHPNRSGRGASRNPTPEEVRAMRTSSGLSAAELGALVHSTGRRVQEWCEGKHRMHPAVWELLTIKLKRATK